MPPAERRDDPSSAAASVGPALPAGPTLPVQLHLTGRRCVVVGAGPVGARRARALLAADAAVTVVAPRVHPSLQASAAAGELRVEEREVREADLDGAVLVVTATGRQEVDEAVGAAARARGALVNRADDAAEGDVSFPALVRRGPVSVAVSTAGRAPVAARWVAEVLDDGLDGLIGLGPEGYGTLVEVLEEVRAELRRTGPGGTGVTSGPLNWRAALDGSILDLIDQGRRAEAKERLLACLSSS